MPPFDGPRPSAIRVDSCTDKGASSSGEGEGWFAEVALRLPRVEDRPYEKGGQPADRCQTPVAVSRPLIRWVMANR